MAVVIFVTYIYAKTPHDHHSSLYVVLSFLLLLLGGAIGSGVYFWDVVRWIYMNMKETRYSNLQEDGVNMADFPINDKFEIFTG